jgi:hypothetical protein
MGVELREDLRGVCLEQASIRSGKISIGCARGPSREVQISDLTFSRVQFKAPTRTTPKPHVELTLLLVHDSGSDIYFWPSCCSVSLFVFSG